VNFNRLMGILVLSGLSFAVSAHASTLTYGFTFNDNNAACSDPSFFSNTDQCFNYRTGETGSGNLTVDASLIDAVGPQTVSLSSLTAENAATGFSYSLTLIPGNFSLLFTGGSLTSGVDFTFNDGLMTGISFTAVCGSCGDTLSVTGTTYEHRDGGNHYYYGPWSGQQTIDQMGTLSFAAPVNGVATGGTLPEPSTWLLIAGGLMGAGVIRRRATA
jgi:hypothetical protein